MLNQIENNTKYTKQLNKKKSMTLAYLKTEHSAKKD